MTTYLYPATEGHDYSCRTFQDFSKAFDTVNQNILFTKLEYYDGISGVVKDWFSSYLSNKLKRYHLVPLFLKCIQYFVGCLKDQYWGHSFSLFI